MKNLTITILFLLSFNLFAETKESIELDVEEADVAVSTELESHPSTCLEDYRKWRNNAAIASGLTPIVGLAGLTGSVMLGLGWEYGGWYAFKEAIGPLGVKIAGGAINFVIPTGVFVGTVFYETAMISRFIKASKSYRLLKSLYTHEDQKLLYKLTRKVQKRRPEVTVEDVERALLLADASGQLCDGSMVSRFVILRTKYNKRLATMRDMKKWLIKNL